MSSTRTCMTQFNKFINKQNECERIRGSIIDLPMGIERDKVLAYSRECYREDMRLFNQYLDCKRDARFRECPGIAGIARPQ